MVVTIVKFPPTADSITVDEAREKFGGNAESYLGVPGLLFKAYVRSEDGHQVGGVYWWSDRASAEAKYNKDWQAGMLAKYGSLPDIEYLDAPVVVDPRAGAVFTEPPELPEPPA